MTKPTIVIEQFITDFVNDIYPSLGNEYSYLYGLENTESYIAGAAYHLDTAKDIYTLMDKDSTKAYSAMYDTLAFFLFGWAAPYQPGDELPASQHSDRIRIMLALFSDIDGNVVAAMKHCDDPSEPLAFQHGEQQGELYNAIQSLYN
jgi:hypothetical protein